MKVYSILISVSTLMVLASSCTKTEAVTIDDQVDTTAHLKLSGTFANGPFGNVTGDAKIYLKNGQYYLSLEHFTTTDGPALKVYISQEVLPINYIKLGDLTAINGDQIYEINNMPDFKKYKYALIHCEQYNHLFGSAELK